MIYIAILFAALFVSWAYSTTESCNRLVHKSYRLVKFFELDNDQDKKKAPTAATVGARNFSKKIYAPSLSRKAAK